MSESPYLSSLARHAHERGTTRGGGDRESESAHVREFAEVQAFFDAYVEDQRPGSVLVLHSPRGDTSRALVKDWRRRLTGHGEAIFEGACARGGGNTYLALRQLVSSTYAYLDDMGLLSDLAHRLFVEVSGSLGLADVSPATRQRRRSQPGQVYFYELVGRFFVEASRLKPAVLVIRDLHLADSASLAAIVHLAENSALDPVDVFIPEGVQREGFRGLLVLTFQSAPESRSASLLNALTRGLRDRPHVAFVDMRRVDEETVQRFLTQPETVARFLAVTEGDIGNLRALLDTLPSAPNGLFLARMSDLSVEAKRLLEVLAVVGHDMSPSSLSALTAGGHSTTEAVDQLLAAGILTRLVSRGSLSIGFSQPSFATLVYDNMASERRREVHASLAEVLAERHRLGQPVDIEEIAHHQLAGGRREELLEHVLAAADKLNQNFAFERAREMLTLALAMIDRASDRERVIERLIDLSSSLGDHVKALFYCGQLKKIRHGGDLVAVYRRIGKALLDMGKYELAVQALAKSMQHAAESPDPLELVRVLSYTAEALYGRGEYDRAIEVCKQGLDRAEERDADDETQHLVMDLTNTMGKVCLFREDYQLARDYFALNRERAETAGLPDEEIRALVNLGTIAVQRRAYDVAEGVFIECLSFSGDAAHPLTRAFCMLNLAVIYQKTLRYGEALDSYLHSLAAFKKSGNDLQFAVTAMNLAVLYELLGDLPKAKALTETSMELTRAREMRYFHSRNCYVRGMIALNEKDPQTALDYLDRALQGFSAAGRTMRARVALSMAGAHHALKQKLDRDEWLSRVELSDDTAESRELTGDHALAVAGFLADEGAWAGAEERARTARRIFHTAQLPEKLWRANLELARITRAQARLNEANLFIAEAASAVERLVENVPEPLRKSYLKTHEQRKLRGLKRALERPDPLEDLESFGISQEMNTLAPADVSVVVIGEPLSDDVMPWRNRYKEIVGEDRRLHHLFKLVDKISASDSTVLLTGGSGTGKELFAEAIHRHSSRREGPLVKVNCAAFVETLLLSELFGHEKGAFTGALSKKRGRFEIANSGTIFLDEIGDVSPNTQVALLRVLQEQTFERVGGSQQLETDVRVITATNRNLEEMVREGTFRLDLYYRLKGIALELPSLRERRADIPLLVRHFTQKFSGDDGRRRVFTADALRLLSSYNWPGNIRELENFVRSMLLFVETDVIGLGDIRQFDEFFADDEMSDDVPHFEFIQGWWPAVEPSKKGTPETGTNVAELPSQEGPAVEKLSDDPGRSQSESAETARPDPVGVTGSVPSDPQQAMVNLVVSEGLGLQEVKKRLEIECIKRALNETNGNITHAARLLKMKRPRLSQIINSDEELSRLKSDLG